MKEVTLEEKAKGIVSIDMGNGETFECSAGVLQNGLDAIFGQRDHRHHGRWILEKDDEWMGGAACRCSVCQHAYAVGAYFGIDEANFCPTCGAEMNGGDENEAD